jgi:hypothetical protein
MVVDSSLLLSHQPHDRRWMMFVDGENFTIRSQIFAKTRGITMEPGSYYRKDVFVWLPGVPATQNLVSNAHISL